MPIKTFVLITSLMLLPTLVTAKVKQTKLKLSTAKQIKIPKSIVTENLTFKKGEVNIYDNPSFGAAVSYQDKAHPQMVVTYYIYPMDDKNIPAELLMSVQYEGLKAQMEEAHQIKNNTTVLLLEELKQVGQHETFYNKHNIVGESGDLISETYLTHDQFHYLKIRISYPRYKATEYNPLSAKLANLLIANTTVKEKKATTISIIVSTTDTDDEAIESARILNQLAYLTALAGNLNHENLIHHFKKQMSIMETFASIIEELTTKEGRNDNILYIHDIKNEGYLDEYVWLNMRQKHWHEPKNLEIEAFQSWMDTQQNKEFYFDPNAGMVQLKFE